MEPIPAQSNENLSASERIGAAAKTALSYVVCYAMFFFSAALMFFTLFMVGRGLILRWSAQVIERPYTRGIFDKFGVLIFGLIWLGFAIYVERYYRYGLRRNKLFKRFGRVTVIELCLLAVIGVAFLLVGPA